MIRPFLLFSSVIIFHCISLSAYSQQSNLTAYSIRGRYNTHTAKVYSYLDYGRTFENTNPDSATYYYQKAEALALKLKDNQALSICMAHYIKLLNHLAKFEEALILAQQHVAMAERLNDPAILLLAYNEVANEYEYLGEYQPATEYYLKTLRLAAMTGDKKMQRIVSNNLSSVFLSLKDYPTAYQYSTSAFHIAKAQRDTVTMGNCMINMGLSELHLQKYQQALHHFDEAERIGYYIPDMTLVADALSNKGLVYLTTKDLSAAARLYQMEKAIADKYNLRYQKLYALFQLAVVAKEKKHFTDAAHYAAQAIAIGERLGTLDELMEMYDTMAVIKQKTGDFQKALYYKNKYEAINDSLRNEQVQTNIQRLNIQYRSAQKDKQIAGQNLSIERNKAAMERKNKWMFLFLGGIVALTIILILSWRSYRHKQKLHRQLLLTLQKEHEVNTLKAKMQAREEERNRIGREIHDDIGSALTTILYLSDDLKTQSRQTVMQAAEKIADTAGSVVDKMNEIIWSMNREYDTLDDLIAYTRQHGAEFLENYGLRYRLDVPEIITTLHLTGEQRRNIYLVIKESLHNIVKHACATEVCISFRLADSLHIVIHDNGKGYNNTTRFGNGLKNMRQRMESIGGRFDIICEAGTTIKLECPLPNHSLNETGI